MMTLTNAQIGPLVAQFFLAAAGTWSFSVLFACPKRLLPYGALVGGVGWLVYELAVLLGADGTLASLLAVIPLTLLTRIFSIFCKAPVTVFLLPAERELNELFAIEFEGLDVSQRLFLPEDMLETQGKGQIMPIESRNQAVIISCN